MDKIPDAVLQENTGSDFPPGFNLPIMALSVWSQYFESVAIAARVLAAYDEVTYKLSSPPDG